MVSQRINGKSCEKYQIKKIDCLDESNRCIAKMLETLRGPILIYLNTVKTDSYPVGDGGCFLGRRADHSPTFGAKFKNVLC